MIKAGNSAEGYTKEQIAKIGNTLIFLSERIPDLSKTKALKLLYFLEEASIKKYAFPLLGINFQLWKLGPVERDIYIELSSTLFIFKDYISLKQDNEAVFIIPNTSFVDDEFSDLDMEVLEMVTNSLKNKTAKELVELTHTANRPWYITAKKTGYLEQFENNLLNSTSEEVDMSILLEDSPEKQQFYLENLHYALQSRSIKKL